jgi:hypothetical protein
MKRILVTCAASLLLATVALAHAPRPGPNGGLKVDAGGAHHAELVADGTETVKLFLYDGNDQPVASEGFKGNAILIVNGKPARFSLEPAGGQMLTGKAPSPVETGVRGAVQLTLPDGSTVQAKF